MPNTITFDHIITPMAHIVSRIGVYTSQDSFQYIWRQKPDTMPLLWLDNDGIVNVDIAEVVKQLDGYLTDDYYGLIGWCVVQRIPCVLHTVESSRKAWRP